MIYLGTMTIKIYNNQTNPYNVLCVVDTNDT